MAAEQNRIMIPIMEKVRFHNIQLFHSLLLWREKITVYFLSMIMVKHSLAYPPE